MLGEIQHKYDWDFLVCFKYDKKSKNPFGRIFGHCCVFRNVTDNSSVRIDPCFCGIYVIPYNANILTFAESLKKDYNCYVWGVRHDDFKGYNLPIIGDCVNVIKSLLGIKAWWVITPRQLEKYIIKHQIIEDRC